MIYLTVKLPVRLAEGGFQVQQVPQQDGVEADGVDTLQPPHDTSP